MNSFFADKAKDDELLEELDDLEAMDCGADMDAGMDCYIAQAPTCGSAVSYGAAMCSANDAED
jgi:hypothetical protein